MKQTAVEWLVEQLTERGHIIPDHLEEAAMKMEKEQMNLSEIKGISNTINYNNSLYEIFDEEINDVADRLGISNIPMAYFIEGAKWYREQLKQRQ